MNICMIGGGYVGLVSAACFAELGWTVTCVDKDEARVKLLKSGGVPIYEPGLDALIATNAAKGRIHFTMDLAKAASNADFVFLAVGTPMRRGDGQADTSDLLRAVADVAPHLPQTAVIVVKSTVPVGTGREVERILRQHRPDGDFAVCSNPEFLREGSAIKDFMYPDRVLVGTDIEWAREKMRALYAPLPVKTCPVIFSGRESAELSKYAANAFLAVKISFINEVADLCEKVGADVQEVAYAVGRDSRIGDKFLQPGPGYGGSCFPKDVSALIRIAREASAPMSLIEQVQVINAERKIAMASRIERAVGGSIRGKKIAVLGVTFKADTDDMREAPSLVIVPSLADRGADVTVYDPKGQDHGVGMLPSKVKWAASALEAAKDADVTVVLTEWKEFQAIDLADLRRVMRGTLLVDLRNIYDPEAAAAAGLEYHGVGRKPLLRRVRKVISKRPAAVELNGKHSAMNGAA